MTDPQDNINRLLEKLEILLERQDVFAKEIRGLQEEVSRLQSGSKEVAGKQRVERENPAPPPEPKIVRETSKVYVPPKPLEKKPLRAVPGLKMNLEKFIGENLINKIGIAITVIGVGIGAKYAIDHQLVSPLTRIILGYLMGLGLLGFAIRLKEKYDNFSAVLLSGAMAIMYFITYAAYSFYALIPQELTFVLMVVFTGFTVLAALKYDKQVIAHIGLVGAYAVPFLLSDDSGKVAVLFSYMAIINAGILFISFKKYWKPLYYSSFFLTWLIYFSWYLPEYQMSKHYTLALTFLSLFFAIFYLTFLSYKVLKKEEFRKDDLFLLLSNSFIFYGIGYSILTNHPTGEQLLGLFTLYNAMVHFVVSIIIYKKRLADKNLFYLISGLVLVFITIAIPVQLDGNWVTLLWAGEAALLFWIGRTKQVPLYEKLAYPLMVLAFISIAHDWVTLYDGYYTEKPETRIRLLFNINFLSSLLFIAAFGFINFLNQNRKYASPLTSQQGLLKFVSYMIPAILLVSLYYSFRMEIATYWDQLYSDSTITLNSGGDAYPKYFEDYDLLRFRDLWIINYSLLFVTLLSLVNMKKLKNRELGYVNLGLNIFAIAIFLLDGLLLLSALRGSYLHQISAEYYSRDLFHLGIRYISLLFMGITLFMCYTYIRQQFMNIDFKVSMDLFIHGAIVWVASSELIHWMDIAESTQSYKLGLSILWGIYSLLLISLGIWKNRKHLRIAAIVLFAVTLIKLFFYDISHLHTLAKTIVFVSLGILLLIISFLYNKYKHMIGDEIQN